MPNEVDPIVRKTVSLPTSVWRRIEDFQFGNRVKRDTEAVRRLIELGLKAAEPAASEPTAPLRSAVPEDAGPQVLSPKKRGPKTR